MSVPYQGNSTKSAVPGIKGTNSVTDTGDATANAIGVYGESNGSAPAARLVLAGVARSVPYSGAGVWGESKGTGAGVAGFNMNASGGPSEYASGGPGVYGESQNAHGVLGFTHGVHEPELTAGVAGISLLLGGKAPGVYGESKGGAGVAGVSHNGPGVSGESQTAEGLIGTSNSRGKAGVAGFASFGTGAGVYGESKGTGAGVSGVTNGTGPGIYGKAGAAGQQGSLMATCT